MRLISNIKNHVRRESWERAEELEQYSEKDQKKIKRAWGLGYMIGYVHAAIYWRWCMITTLCNTEAAMDKFDKKTKEINKEN